MCSSMKRAISQPMVRPPSRHHAFSVPCTLNGTAPSADRLAESVNARIAGRVGGEARALDDVGPELAPAASSRGDSPTSGTKTRIGHCTAAASVAAARAALPHEAMANGGRPAGDDHGARPARSAVTKWSRMPNR